MRYWTLPGTELVEVKSLSFGGSPSPGTSPSPGSLLGEVPPGVGRGCCLVRNMKGTAQTEVANISSHGTIQHFLLSKVVPQTHQTLRHSCKGQCNQGEPHVSELTVHCHLIIACILLSIIIHLIYVINHYSIKVRGILRSPLRIV